MYTTLMLVCGWWTDKVRGRSPPQPAPFPLPPPGLFSLSPPENSNPNTLRFNIDTQSFEFITYILDPQPSIAVEIPLGVGIS